MDKFPSPTVPCPGKSSRTILGHLARIANGEEHIALLADLDKFDLLRRKDDLLAEGVAAVFGLEDANAELLGLCFHAGQFTPAEATQWLARRGI
jgi:hypothetical protein